MPYFAYQDTKTTADLKVTVADIRDLVNAAFMANETDKVAEIKLILSSLAFKNLLPPQAFTVTTAEDTPTAHQTQAPKL